jgi:hypothetical protein
VRGPPARHPDEQREQLPAVEGTIEDAAELKIGDRVVYPNQGVCAVVGVEEKDIAGQKLQLVRMAREEDGASVLVPKNKVPSIGLRRVATGAQMEASSTTSPPSSTTPSSTGRSGTGTTPTGSSPGASSGSPRW